MVITNHVRDFFIVLTNFCNTLLHIQLSTEVSSLARTIILLAVFCYQILFVSGEMFKRHFVEGSDR